MAYFFTRDIEFQAQFSDTIPEICQQFLFCDSANTVEGITVGNITNIIQAGKYRQMTESAHPCQENETEQGNRIGIYKNYKDLGIIKSTWS